MRKFFEHDRGLQCRNLAWRRFVLTGIATPLLLLLARLASRPTNTQAHRHEEFHGDAQLWIAGARYMISLPTALNITAC
ncbi:MAG: hypothetical protein ACLUGU_11280 [Alistipes shahii]